MIATRLLFGPLAYAQSLGLDAAGVLSAVHLRPELLEHPDTFVPLTVARDMFALLEAPGANELIALRAAAHVPTQAFDVVRYLGTSSGSVDQAIGQFCRWVRTLATAGAAHVVRSRGAVRVSLDSGPLDSVGPHTGEYVVACLLRGLQEISAGPLLPTQVELRHALTQRHSDRERFFGSPVRLGCAEDALVFSSAAVGQPTRQPDAVLHQLLQRHLRDLEAKLPKTERFVDTVEQLILLELGKTLTLRSVARRLHTSERSLHRRLASEGTSFRRLVDSVRERIARGQLRAPGVSIADVAFLLGFADVPSFHRAFRGWTGQTPGDFAASK